MSQILKQKLSSINAKLFFLFWLIAITSILVTHFISLQFAEDTVILPPHPKESEQLHRIAEKLKRMQPNDIKSYIRNFSSYNNRVILLKNLKTNRILSSKNLKFKMLTDYIRKNNFTSVTSVQFHYARLTGPINIDIGSQQYQVYTARKGSKRHMGRFLMHIPAWARILTPIIISLLFCWLLARTLSRPLSQMQQTAAKIGNGDLSARVGKGAHRNDELGSLAKSINQMASKLEVSLSAHQRLLGDVSHELRSPMTRLQIALALAHKASSKPSDLEKHLNRCELEVNRLDDMIADVLALSRLENTLHNSHFCPVDLSQLIELVCQDAQYLANEKSIIIKSSNLKVCIVEGDNQLLASAFSNILNNAVKYSPENSNINIKMTLSNKHITITVIDNGHGVPESALPEMFKPFYRVADSRDRETGGTGLGLAIAKQAIVTHKGNIEASNSPGGGLAVTITLPIKLI